MKCWSKFRATRFRNKYTEIKKPNEVYIDMYEQTLKKQN